MPELPEVETVVRQLRPLLQGRLIEGARVLWKRTIAQPSAAAFARDVTGRRVEALSRRGKYFVLHLSAQEAATRARGARAPSARSAPVRADRAPKLLVGHLRMTGRLFVDDDPKPPWTRATFPLDNGRHLIFVDVRKFGRLALVDALEQALPAMGPEPLGPEIDGEWMAQALGERKRMLKPLLLDQSFLAGLGNIYVDESLHRARLHPLQLSHRVSRARAVDLAASIRDVLTAAIAKQGSSFDGFYRTPEGQPGDYQHEFTVYGREGEPCLRCAAPIRRIVVGQRGTHFCARCQRAPRKAVGERRRASKAGGSR